MAVVAITAGNVGGGGNSVYSTIPDFKQVITSTATAQSSNAIPRLEYIRIKVTGNAVWVRVNGTASVGNDFYIGDGDVFDCGPTREGDVVSVIDHV